LSAGTVLVAASSSDPDAGYVGERLQQRGLSLRLVLRDRGELPAAVPADVTAVLLLGSAWSVAEPDDPAALQSECDLVRSAVAAGVPVLGLCYGAQVVAHACGGRVRRAAVPEVGLVTVETLDPGLVPTGPWWAFHTDVIDPPPEASVIADNACGTQAFVLPGVLGVQFHPEVRPAVLDDWLERLPSIAAASGRTREELVAEAYRREDQARAASHALVDAFLVRFEVMG
jgi:GMP synthase (glutamine-hydrolysing)